MLTNFALRRKIVKLKKRHELDSQRLERAGELIEYFENALKENSTKNNFVEQLLKRAYKQLEGCGYTESSPLMEDIRDAINVN